jgi:Zn-dependent protease with chaperone function
VNESLGVRALWVALLAVGFWVLAVGLVLLLAAGGLAIVTYAPNYVAAGFVAFLLAGTLAVGLLPKVSWKREEDTPPLASTEQPRLRALVRDTAARAGARLPDELYIFHRANAFAGTRRVRAFARRAATVGIGLPLFAWLDEGELRSVVAHEMGHHVGGDVRLGPWVHRTRRAIARAMDRLEGSSFWFHLPFALYADVFMKVSVRISRAQELAADATAARVAGAAATASALRKIELLSAAWGAYFALEVVPIVERGHLPPLLDGFDRYWRAARTPGTPAFESLSVALDASKDPQNDDTHPVLAERVAALGDPVTASSETRPALALIDHIEQAEVRVVLDLLRDPRATLKPVGWDDIASAVWLPTWREELAPHARVLAGMTPLRLSSAVEGADALADATRQGPAILSPEAERRRVARLLGMWLVAHLADRGFAIRAPPGLAVVAEREGSVVLPFGAVADLMKRRDADHWASTCARCGM